LLRLTIDDAASVGVTDYLASQRARFTAENSKSWARPFSARLLQAGVVSYKDQNRGVSLLRHETIAKCAQTFVGRPVVVCPVDNSGARFKHERLTPENMKALGHGYVTKVYFNAADGWWWGDGVVDTDEAQKAIAKVGLCSCSYEGATVARPGKRNDVPYDNEIVEFTGKHVAVVHNPRYEEARIFLNSKEPNQKTMNLLKLFWKKPAATAAAATKTGADATAQKLIENGLTDLQPETKITLVDNAGAEVEVTVGELAEVYNSRGAIDPETEVEVKEGQRVTISKLIEAHNSLAKITEERDNALAEVEKAKKAAPVVATRAENDNAKRPDHFRLVTGAATRPAVASGARPNFGSLDEGVAAGKKMFGSKEPAAS
jgi:hypothetical protein